MEEIQAILHFLDMIIVSSVFMMHLFSMLLLYANFLYRVTHLVLTKSNLVDCYSYFTIRKMRPRNLDNLAKIILLEQGSANFLLKGQRVNIVLASHKVSVTTTQLCCVVQKHA